MLSDEKSLHDGLSDHLRMLSPNRQRPGDPLRAFPLSVPWLPSGIRGLAGRTAARTAKPVPAKLEASLPLDRAKPKTPAVESEVSGTATRHRPVPVLPSSRAGSIWRPQSIHFP